MSLPLCVVVVVFVVAAAGCTPHTCPLGKRFDVVGGVCSVWCSCGLCDPCDCVLLVRVLFMLLWLLNLLSLRVCLRPSFTNDQR